MSPTGKIAFCKNAAPILSYGSGKKRAGPPFFQASAKPRRPGRPSLRVAKLCGPSAHLIQERFGPPPQSCPPAGKMAVLPSLIRGFLPHFANAGPAHGPPLGPITVMSPLPKQRGPYKNGGPPVPFCALCRTAFQLASPAKPSPPAGLPYQLRTGRYSKNVFDTYPLPSPFFVGQGLNRDGNRIELGKKLVNENCPEPFQSRSDPVKSPSKKNFSKSVNPPPDGPTIPKY